VHCCNLRDAVIILPPRHLKFHRITLT
jgi:hypothetical protein